MNPTKINISAIQENPNNPRNITDEQFEKLCDSLRQFPEMMELRPLVVREVSPGKYMPLGGNMRHRAAKAIGWKDIWAIVANDLTAEQAREFMLKDNISYGEWDWPAITAYWPEAPDWGLTIPEMKFEDPEVHEDDFKIPTKIKTDLKPGDMLEIGPHRLICGDSTQEEPLQLLMAGRTADLILTDPPYNVNYAGSDGQTMENDNQPEQQFIDFLTAAMRQAFAHTKPGGAIYVWHADSNGLEFRHAFRTAGFDLKQCLIWVKNSLVMGHQDYHWKHEPCLYGWKPGAAHYFTPDRTKSTVIEDELELRKLSKADLLKMLEEIFADKTKTTVLRFNKPTKNDVHPTMKPVVMLAELIDNSTKPGELVLDQFVGSGSTMVAAHQLGRTCYAVDLAPEFCQVTLDRMRKLDPSIPITLNGNPT